MEKKYLKEYAIASTGSAIFSSLIGVLLMIMIEKGANPAFRVMLAYIGGFLVYAMYHFITDLLMSSEARYDRALSETIYRLFTMPPKERQNIMDRIADEKAKRGDGR